MARKEGRDMRYNDINDIVRGIVELPLEERRLLMDYLVGNICVDPAGGDGEDQDLPCGRLLPCSLHDS